MASVGAMLRQGIGTAAVAAAAAALLALGAAEPLRRETGDALVRLVGARWPAPLAPPDVAVVALDPQSLRAYPDWPWPRSRYGALVARLDAAGAAAIAFDIDFSTPRDPADDAAFAAAMTRSGRVALAAFRQSQEAAPGVTVEVASVPAEPLASAAAAIGSVLVPVDGDGRVRRFPPESEIGGLALPSLAGAALEIAGVVSVVPDDAPGFLPVDYRRARPEVPVLSAVDVLDGRADPSLVRGRVVLVGATAAEFQDLWPTPLGPARPGVWIQALAVRTLAARAAGLPGLRRPGPAAEVALVLLVSLLAYGLAARGQRQRMAGLAGLGAALVASSAGLLARTGWLVDPVLPLGVVGAHYVLGLESVRRRFGRSLAERELSLSALFRVGQATARAQEAGAASLDTALALLGDVVEASGVAFLRADDGGRLDGHRLEWARAGGRPVGDPTTAERVLAAGALRVFEGALPGTPSRPGLAVYVPLRVGERAVGVLAVERDGRSPLDETQLRTIATVGTQLALSAQNLRLIENLQAAFQSSVEAMASAIEARDGYTESHCRRLAAFATAMGERIGLSERELEAIRLGALLHDVGKIGVRDEILLKPGRFTPEERREMERHAEVGWRIVVPIHGVATATLDCVRHHHERWDGRGYPDGLAGEQIPLGARIVSVVDVWDALSTDRPYKAAYPQDRVRAILQKGRGVLFDPDLLDLFLRVLDEEGEEMLAVIDRTRAVRT